MARLSKADAWPSEIRELVGKLRSQGASIDAIRTKLLELEVEVPRSTLGRHIQELDEVIADLRKSREIAEAIGTRLDEKDGDAHSALRANIELLQSLTMRTMVAARGKNVEAKEAKALSEVLRNLATASKVDLDRELKIRTEVQAKALAAAEKALAGDEGKAIDREAVLKRIREEVYGIVG